MKMAMVVLLWCSMFIFFIFVVILLICGLFVVWQRLSLINSSVERLLEGFNRNQKTNDEFRKENKGNKKNQTCESAVHRFHDDCGEIVTDDFPRDKPVYRNYLQGDEVGGKKKVDDRLIWSERRFGEDECSAIHGNWQTKDCSESRERFENWDAINETIEEEASECNGIDEGVICHEKEGHKDTPSLQVESQFFPADSETIRRLTQHSEDDEMGCGPADEMQDRPTEKHTETGTLACPAGALAASKLVPEQDEDSAPSSFEYAGETIHDNIDVPQDDEGKGNIADLTTDGIAIARDVEEVEQQYDRHRPDKDVSTDQQNTEQRLVTDIHLYTGNIKTKGDTSGEHVDRPQSDDEKESITDITTDGIEEQQSNRQKTDLDVFKCQQKTEQQACTNSQLYTGIVKAQVVDPSFVVVVNPLSETGYGSITLSNDKDGNCYLHIPGMSDKSCTSIQIGDDNVISIEADEGYSSFNEGNGESFDDSLNIDEPYSDGVRENASELSSLESGYGSLESDKDSLTEPPEDVPINGLKNTEDKSETNVPTRNIMNVTLPPEHLYNLIFNTCRTKRGTCGEDLYLQLGHRNTVLCPKSTGCKVESFCLEVKLKDIEGFFHFLICVLPSEQLKKKITNCISTDIIPLRDVICVQACHHMLLENPKEDFSKTSFEMAYMKETPCPVYGPDPVQGKNLENDHNKQCTIPKFQNKVPFDEESVHTDADVSFLHNTNDTLYCTGETHFDHSRCLKTIHENHQLPRPEVTDFKQRTTEMTSETIPKRDARDLQEDKFPVGRVGEIFKNELEERNLKFHGEEDMSPNSTNRKSKTCCEIRSSKQTPNSENQALANEQHIRTHSILHSDLNAHQCDNESGINEPSVSEQTCRSSRPRLKLTKPEKGLIAGPKRYKGMPNLEFSKASVKRNGSDAFQNLEDESDPSGKLETNQAKEQGYINLSQCCQEYNIKSMKQKKKTLSLGKKTATTAVIYRPAGRQRLQKMFQKHTDSRAMSAQKLSNMCRRKINSSTRLTCKRSLKCVITRKKRSQCAVQEKTGPVCGLQHKRKLYQMSATKRFGSESKVFLVGNRRHTKRLLDRHLQLNYGNGRCKYKDVNVLIQHSDNFRRSFECRYGLKRVSFNRPRHALLLPERQRVERKRGKISHTTRHEKPTRRPAQYTFVHDETNESLQPIVCPHRKDQNMEGNCDNVKLERKKQVSGGIKSNSRCFYQAVHGYQSADTEKGYGRQQPQHSLKVEKLCGRLSVSEPFNGIEERIKSCLREIPTDRYRQLSHALKIECLSFSGAGILCRTQNMDIANGMKKVNDSIIKQFFITELRHLEIGPGIFIDKETDIDIHYTEIKRAREVSGST